MRILENFSKFVLNKKNGNTKFKDSIKSIELIEAIIKSIKYARKINL
jgi:hypothetical protein